MATLVVFGVLWGLFRLFLGGDPYDFDPQGKEGGFEPHLQRYQSLAKLILTLATGAAAFLFKFLVDLPLDAHTLSNNLGLYSRAMMQAAPLAISFLGISAFWGLIFILVQTYLYEAYCQSENKDSYTGNQYSAVLACGWSSFLWFLFAFGFLAYRILDLGG